MGGFIVTITITLLSLTLSRTNSETSATDAGLFTSELVIPRQSIARKRSADKLVSYRIDGFNQRFDLSLRRDTTFLAPTFFTQYFSDNQTWVNRNTKHCFYRGFVNDNRASVVSLSLCNGLFGTFIYNNTEYFIEPKPHATEHAWKFEHLLYTHTHRRLSPPAQQRNYCGVLDKPHFEERDGLDSQHLSNHSTRRRRKLSFDQMAKHVKILLAYDNSIKEFHPDIDIKSYILTLLSYVSYLYSDASIGNNIKIWLVKLVELGNDLSTQIKATEDAAGILRQFCQWQRDYNTPSTYDAAVLLTRVPLCNTRAKNITDSKCDTLGITELGTMCNATANCAVVRDNGFATAFTIAHEIAHLFGVRHDNDQVCWNFNKEQNLMATSLFFNYNHYKWSNCSRHYFTQYLESNRYPCLNNPPDVKSSSFEGLNNEQTARELPGRFNDLDNQCRRAFGTDFEYCKDLSHGPKCTRLYCRQKSLQSSSCITNHAHWSDGTLCFESKNDIKRCFHGQCRSNDDLLAISGNWGEWSAWSPCTRTCGSAIRKSQRFCDNPKPQNGGQYCSGLSTRIQSCENSPPCENSVDMFRHRQCSAYDNQTIDLSLPVGVRFEPKYNVLSSERCKLICKVSDDPLERSFIFSDRVEDGTPCGREEETRDICISGTCMPIGCDNKYGSNATEDVCGICNGQNRTCKSIHGQKVVSNLGITPIIDIPLNTTRVTITQISPGVDRYYLAVKYANGTYILNGMHSLQLYNSQIRLDGATLFYNGFGHSNESILISGRLHVALEIQVVSIYQTDPPPTEVYWEYYIPYDEDDFVRHSEYQSVDYQCDRPCQGHKQAKKCLIHETEYESIYCSIFKLPFEYQTERCNDHCVLSWTARYQQACSTRCGDGFKRVLFQCTKGGSMMESIDEDVCKKYVGEKPTDVIACVGDCTAVGWVYGAWGECHDAGTCVRRRLAECRNSSDLTIADAHCNAEFLLNVERCPQADCEQSRWTFTAWSECDCTSRHRWRNVSCIRHGEVARERDCQHETKPDDTISCSKECPKPRWQVDAWQSCTATCSSPKGARHRRVVCSYNDSIIQEEFCDRKSKPIEQESCTSNSTCLIWFADDGLLAQVTCGLGRRQRRVYCSDLSRSKTVVSDSDCESALGEKRKPVEEESCSITECPHWQLGPWNNCSDIYNHKPSTAEVCSEEDYCPEWVAGLWSECSVTCGTGMQNRSIWCQDKNGRVKVEECNELTRPTNTKQCHMNLCQNARAATWTASDWTECDPQTCTQTRTIGCVDSMTGETLPMPACTETHHRPPATRTCPISKCLEWQIGQWDGCSVKCGFGIEYGSDLHCYTRDSPRRQVNSSECESVEPPLEKPASRRICRRHCIEWRTNDLTRSLFETLLSPTIVKTKTKK